MKIKAIIIALLSIDTRSVEFAMALLNFVWGWWLLLANEYLVTQQGDVVIDHLAGYGGTKVWGIIFMILFAVGAVFTYRSVIHHEVVFWNVRFYTMIMSAIMWLAFSIFFVSVGGFFSIPAFIFFGVGMVSLLGGNLLRWDYVTNR